MAKHHRSYNYKFAERSHSPKGIVALLVSLCSIGAGGVLVVLSLRQGGELERYLAMGGIGALLVAFVGFCLAIASVREAEHYRLFPVLALIFSIAALAGWIGIYVLGFLFG